MEIAVKNFDSLFRVDRDVLLHLVDIIDTWENEGEVDQIAVARLVFDARRGCSDEFIWPEARDAVMRVEW